MREIGRTSVNGQKPYVNDPDNERRPRGVESQRERGLRVSLIKVMVKGMGERERDFPHGLLLLDRTACK